MPNSLISFRTQYNIQVKPGGRPITIPRIGSQDKRIESCDDCGVDLSIESHKKWCPRT